MFKALSLAALGLVAVAGAASAADDHAAPAAATKAIAPAAAPAAAPATAELKDGTKVQISGDKVFVVAKDGKQTPAPDGVHVLKDGKSIETKGGLVVKH